MGIKIGLSEAEEMEIRKGILKNLAEKKAQMEERFGKNLASLSEDEEMFCLERPRGISEKSWKVMSKKQKKQAVSEAINNQTFSGSGDPWY